MTGSSLRLWGRLAVTIGLLAAVFVMPHIGLPGIDASGLDGVKNARNIDVFALGFSPFVMAMLLVEVVASGI
jgi:preprotein translocase subunit SecY